MPLFLLAKREPRVLPLAPTAFTWPFGVLPFFTVLAQGRLLKEQLRILGSPACLEPCRAKPTGAGGPRAVKIKPLELYDEKSEPFRP